MTEEDWLKAEGPSELLEYLGGKRLASERKLRLLAVALCKLWGLFTDDRLLRALDVAEGYADGRVEEQVRAEAESVMLAAYDREYGRDDEFAVSCVPILLLLARGKYTCGDAERAARGLANSGCYAEQDWIGEHYPELALEQVVYVRDIYGNPFRPVTARPAWLTSTVVQLAAGIYQDRAFDRLPILADALIDAGCANEDMLGHCRSEGPHCRGCWLIDLLLGKF